MKLSELIAELQRIAESVPFDSEIVTGSDWNPQHLESVHHEPPYTFLTFTHDAEES
ncbi:hypothetical protein GCM10011403_29550 [Pseudohongiella nitratireducens]|uniref:Uncharacterized protein n=1 Tax=Pseudohongiella nitratireducens TaxID=1768907 RepID=A0A916QPI7_9GAMM|nr:hypothetical protein [Pseudohongiella nitratireducens]GFZ84098.1 hypothetical protein GCM10011403_29550 [Pseudohongiella nitratireducens]